MSNACHFLFGRALRILVSGFPTYGACEFERAREALRGGVAPDIAGALVSDSVLVLSQLGSGVMQAGDREDVVEAILSVLARLQTGEMRSAEQALGRLQGASGPVQMLPMLVLSKRLSLAGVRIRPAPALRIIVGGRAVEEPHERAGTTRLRLVSSR